MTLGKDESTRTGREWEFDPPPVLVPCPAAEGGSLRGRRLIAHDPKREVWRYDVRADTEPYPDPHSGVLVVGILPEDQWYRRQREQRDGASTSVIVPYPLPLSWLWVETLVDAAGMAPEVPDQSEIPADGGPSRALVADASRPPVRWLTYGPHAHRVTGARICLMAPEGPRFGLRACGEPRKAVLDGVEAMNLTRGFDSLNEPLTVAAVPICTELAWYDWQQTGLVPLVRAAEMSLVWLE